MAKRLEVKKAVVPVDITKEVLTSMRNTIDHWLKYPGPLSSGGNHISSIEYIGDTKEGWHVYQMQVWHDQSFRPERKLRKDGFDMMMTLAKYIGWDTSIGPWQRKIDRAKLKGK
jgi:hypothetical protein